MSQPLQVLRAKLASEQFLFVVVNIAVNTVFLVRSYVTMRVLDYGDLGLVALMQTLILLVGTLQLGLLNGGYRLLCSEPADGAIRINNLVHTCILLLSVVAFAVAAPAWFFAPAPRYFLVAMLGVFAGILTLLRTWMTNQLIARGMLSRLNRVNLVAAFASLLLLAAVSLDPLLVCLGSILVQPLVFIADALFVEPSLRPRALLWSNSLLKRVMTSGFVMYLSSVFLLLNGQIERWSILSFLGTDGLGHFYLALLFINLHALVPASLDAIFLPRVVRQHMAGDGVAVRRSLHRFFLLTCGYAVFAALAVLLLARPLLAWLLPQYIGDLDYVYLMLPGLVLLGLTAPFALVFNVLIQYRFYFYAYGAGTVATILLIALYVRASGTMELHALAVIKSLVSVLTAIVIMLGYVVTRRQYPEFRFNPFRPRPAVSG